MSYQIPSIGFKTEGHQMTIHDFFLTNIDFKRRSMAFHYFTEIQIHVDQIQ